MVGHIAPEAVRGGPIAAVRDGDTIAIDVASRRLDVELPDEEIAAPRGGLRGPAAPRRTACSGKYAKLVSSASQGAVTS